MLEHRHRVVIVTPVYDDAPACAILLQQLGKVFGDSLLVVAVDDGSPKVPMRLADIPEGAPDTCILSLRRNVGHQQAIATGLHFIAPQLQAHQRLIIMDSDGEDSPEACQALLAHLDSQNEAVIAVAKRAKRSESLKFRTFYVAYKLLFRMATGRAINFGNFMAMTPRAAQKLASMPELSTHVAAAALASQQPLTRLPVDRSRRYHGQSKMNFSRLVQHGLKAIMVFSEDAVARSRFALLCSATISALLLCVMHLLAMTSSESLRVIAGLAICATALAGISMALTMLLQRHRASRPVAAPATSVDNTQAILHRP
ncbi:glycosyltransferase [Diaphorobacter sp. HDW4B]|uniref:glycosyltransferase n=1 Tax=Diaphorobacter sp. HDW4B TaxID=2714925 RepID=UPI001409CD19|nr:glycosyltransferase [Diaphorobacter sp. HDW4B]QIL72531.1 glycosyltransferase [Diaphorobacter sp. HDW4B]